MFNEISIDRRDDNGNIVQTLRVPLGYAPKQKFLARIDAVPDTDRKAEVILPRMAFEMIGIDYDPSRKTNMLHQSRVYETQTLAKKTYGPVPYNIAVSLYIYAKNQDDALQIVEQIFPYFNPDFNLSVKAVPELSLVHDLMIVLNAASYDDMYEGDFSERRAIMWTLDFTIKLLFYGPITRQGVIRRAIANTIISVGDIENFEGETFTNVFTEFDDF